MSTSLVAVSKQPVDAEKWPVPRGAGLCHASALSDSALARCAEPDKISLLRHMAAILRRFGGPKPKGPCPGGEEESVCMEI